MSKCRLLLTALLSIALYSNIASAKEFPVQARLFVGSTSVDPENVNTTISAQGLQKFENLTQYGLEITYPLLQYLDVGVRYTKRTGNNEENPANASTDYWAKIDQDSLLLIARVPLLKSDLVRLDAFAGFGGSNTTFKVKTASQDGELTRSAGEGWAATPYTAFGASVAVGYKWIYFVAEGGVESNKVDGFTRSGNVNSAIDTLDLSGSYFTIGIMMDGIPGSTK